MVYNELDFVFFAFFFISYIFALFSLPDITKLRLQAAADVARQVEAELEEKSLLQTQEHEARLAQLASDTESILSLEKKLAELALQHGRELERATEQHAEELRQLEDRVRVIPGCDSHMLPLCCTNIPSPLCCTNTFI